MSLPDDILDYVLSFLQSDLVALRACSQSHPKFTQLVERYIYVSVTLYDNKTISENGLDTRQFIDLLFDKPYIAKYIRSMEILATYDRADSFQRIEDMASVLRQCSLLNKVTLKQSTFGWAVLPQAFRSAFLDLLHLPSMEDVCISHVDGFPVTTLDHSKTLKRLALHKWTPDDRFIPEHSSHPFLEQLSIQSCTRLSIQKILPWVQAQNLRSLEFCSNQDIEPLQSLLSICSNTLTDLRIDISSQFRSYYEFQMGTTSSGRTRTIPLSLAALICLEKLTISADLDFYFRAGYRDLPNVFGFRSSISAIAELLETTPTIHCLTLDFHCRIEDTLSLPYDPDALWSPLVTLVSESSAPSVDLSVRASSLHRSEAISPQPVLKSFKGCEALARMIDSNALVITPVMPNPPAPKSRVNESSNQVERKPTADSSNGRDARKSRRWWVRPFFHTKGRG